MKTLNQPKKGDYSKFYSTYLKLVTGNNYKELILDQIDLLTSLFREKGNEWSEKAYAEGKWTPKEILGHMIDTERIMTFRALCFARGEKSALPGFEQDPYVLHARFGEIPLEVLIEDFIAQRMSLLSMVKTLHEDTLDLIGHASGNPITPRALLWIIPGHFKHHFQILIEKY